MTAASGRHCIGEILRSTQKDDQHIHKIRDDVSGLIVDVLGHGHWAGKESWIEPVIRFAYYSATTLSDYQTLGEEYTGLVQTQGNYVLPSKFKRLIFIIIKSFGGKLIQFVLQFIQRKDVNNEHTRKIEALRTILSWVESINTCLFYYQGLYWEISRRLTGLQYVKIDQQPRNNLRAGFRILGHVSVLHLLLNICIQFYKWSKVQSHQQSSPQQRPVLKEDNSGDAERCPLCLDPVGVRGGAAASMCGHLGCWTCLLEAASLSGDCPICRATIKLQQIIPLRNLWPNRIFHDCII